MLAVPVTVVATGPSLGDSGGRLMLHLLLLPVDGLTDLPFTVTATVFPGVADPQTGDRYRQVLLQDHVIAKNAGVLTSPNARKWVVGRMERPEEKSGSFILTVFREDKRSLNFWAQDLLWPKNVRLRLLNCTAYP